MIARRQPQGRLRLRSASFAEKSEQDIASVRDVTIPRPELATALQGRQSGELEAPHGVAIRNLDRHQSQDRSRSTDALG